MSTRYHWQDGNENKDIVPLPPPSSPKRALLVLAAGAVVAAALIVAGAIVWQQAQRGQRAAQSDLQAIVDTEAAALDRGDEEVFLSLQDFNHRQWYRDQELYWSAVQRASAEEPGAEIGDLAVTEVELRDDRAWVEVQYELDGVPYRRAQFYRLSDGNWLHTAPDERFWGERREIDTQHLRFVTNEREEHIVRPVAEALERLYQQVLSDFAVQAPARQVTFEFRPVAEAGPAMYSEAHFLAPSPLLLGVRSDDQVDPDLLASLAQSVGLFLAIEKSGLYVREPGPGGSWAMLKGLVAWEVEQRLSLAAVPAEWTQWLHDATATDTLPPLSGLWPPYQFRTERDSAIAFVQAQSIVGYAVSLRGLAVLPLLLECLGQKLSAAETILTAVQMDLPVFEAGWRAYLGDQPAAGARGPGPDAGALRFGPPFVGLAARRPSGVPPEFQLPQGFAQVCRPCTGGTWREFAACCASVSTLWYGTSL